MRSSILVKRMVITLTLTLGLFSNLKLAETNQLSIQIENKLSGTQLNLGLAGYGQFNLSKNKDQSFISCIKNIGKEQLIINCSNGSFKVSKCATGPFYRLSWVRTKGLISWGYITERALVIDPKETSLSDLELNQTGLVFSSETEIIDQEPRTTFWVTSRQDPDQGLALSLAELTDLNLTGFVNQKPNFFFHNGGKAAVTTRTPTPTPKAIEKAKTLWQPTNYNIFYVLQKNFRQEIKNNLVWECTVEWSEGDLYYLI